MCQERNYNMIAQRYYNSQEIHVEETCNGWTAINTGDDLVTVSGIPLKPYPPGHAELTGAAIAIPGNKDEIYHGRIWIQFAGIGAAPEVVIIQKYYEP